jgi:hypothetical protein
MASKLNWNHFADIDARIRPILREFLLPGEDSALFRQSLCDHLAKFNPATPFELDLVEQITLAHWRLRRAEAVEHAVTLQLAGAPLSGGPLDKLAASFFDVPRTSPLLAVQRYRTAMSLEVARLIRRYGSLRTQPPAPPDAREQSVPAPALAVLRPSPLLSSEEPLLLGPTHLLERLRGLRACPPLERDPPQTHLPGT